MDSEAYWTQRAEEREQYWHKKCQETIERELASYYRASLGRIQTDIAALYGRFAVDNELTMAEARKLLKGNEFRQWRMDIAAYVKKIEATGDKGLERELNVLAMRSRISRLDKLYSETLVELDKLGRKVSKNMKSFLTDAYKDNYYHGLYDIAKVGELKNAISKVDSKALEDVLRTRWSGKNYSERIWKNQKLLAQTVKAEMMTAIHRGESIEKISARIAKRMDVGISNARRLVRTELNFVNNQAAFESIEDVGMKYYRFIATLDRRTSDKCRSMDGKVFLLKDRKFGVNIPPLHPNCRSTVAGSLYGLNNVKTGTRVARDGDGKTVYVPANMKYDDWKEVFVDKKLSLEDWVKDHILDKVKTKNNPSDIIIIKEALSANTTKLKGCMDNADYNNYMNTLAHNEYIRNLYIEYADDIDAISHTKNGGVYRGNNTIEFDYTADRYIQKGKSKYSTLAHEYGHFFDAKAKFKGLKFTEVDMINALSTIDNYVLVKRVPSASDEFLAAVRADKEFLRSIWSADTIKKLRERDASAGVQDAASAFFVDGHIGWHHTDKYWNRKYHTIKTIFKKHKELKKIYADMGFDASNLSKTAMHCRIYEAASETWANIMSAVTNGGEELEFIKEYMPNSYKTFIEILGRLEKK